MLNSIFTAFLMFEPMNFVHNLKYMIIGMICIIIVMAVLIAITTILNKVASRPSGKDKK